MCGISALFAMSRENLISLDEIQQMTHPISHRGPDDEGYVLFSSEAFSIYGGENTPPSVYHSRFPFSPKLDSKKSPLGHAALGHRRLSILDLSPAGHQPMCDEQENMWITYNGEVYNYQEIRKKLENLGHSFSSQTDTEVILKAYKEWGTDAFSSFNGMFAFIIFDFAKKQGIAVRDRFGVKPLYYWLSPKGLLAFASEIKQFTFLREWNPMLEGQVAYDFLNWGLIDHTEKTFFSGVKQLRGGELLEFHLFNLHKTPLQIKKWYTLNPKPYLGNLVEAGKDFYQLLTDSIRLRLRADVDMGSCLSGGLDSSSIVCLVNQMLSCDAIGKQKTFSACSEIQKYDEKSYIDCVVSQTKVDPYFTYPSLENLFEELPKIIWHQDEPFSSTSIYAQWEVFKLVKRERVKVMLDGQGADEQLGGYHGFFGNYFYDLWKSLKWKTLYGEIKAAKAMHPGLNPLLQLGNKIVPHALRDPIRRLLGKTSSTPYWLNTLLLNAEERNPYEPNNHKEMGAQSVQQLLRTSVPMLLHYEDRDSMAHSVESRTPFLDFRLVEFCLGLPSEYKISKGWTKNVLRKGMEGVLPDLIRMRKDKMGFLTAEEDWIRNRDSKTFKKELERAIDSSSGILKPNATYHLEEIISGHRPFDYLPWRQITFGYWMETFSVRLN